MEKSHKIIKFHQREIQKFKSWVPWGSQSDINLEVAVLKLKEVQCTFRWTVHIPLQYCSASLVKADSR